MRIKTSHLKQALKFAADEVYYDEVVRTGMEDIVIGQGCDFVSKEEWILAKIAEWLSAAEIVDAINKTFPEVGK